MAAKSNKGPEAGKELPENPNRILLLGTVICVEAIPLVNHPKTFSDPAQSLKGEGCILLKLFISPHAFELELKCFRHFQTWQTLC
jgi:hypothetical protein